MGSKGRNVKKLDVDDPDPKMGSPRGYLKRILQSRETWKIRGWGFRATREYVETSTYLSEKEDDGR
jgi:hypothetical protein